MEKMSDEEGGTGKKKRRDWKWTESLNERDSSEGIEF